MNTTNLPEIIDVDFVSDYGADNATYVITITKTLENIQDLKLIVSMDFESQITDTLQGVYKTSYTNVETGKQE